MENSSTNPLNGAIIGDRVISFRSQSHSPIIMRATCSTLCTLWLSKCSECQFRSGLWARWNHITLRKWRTSNNLCGLPSSWPFPWKYYPVKMMPPRSEWRFAYRDKVMEYHENFVVSIWEAALAFWVWYHCLLTKCKTMGVYNVRVLHPTWGR